MSYRFYSAPVSSEALVARPQYKPLTEVVRYPLAEVPRGLTGVQRLLIAVVVVIVIVALIYWLTRRPKRVEANRRSRMSTATLAKLLRNRLTERGGVSDTTMRSLARLSKVE